MFKAIHGSAPDIAGKNIANPSGLLQASVMMLHYIGQNEVAAKIGNAWLKTIEDGIHTADIFKQSTSTQLASTWAFMAAVAARLGQQPVSLTPAPFLTGSADYTATLPAQNAPEKGITGRGHLYRLERAASG